MLELWKDIIGFKGYYEVSNFGYIRRCDSGYIQKHQTGDPYPRAGLSKKSKTITRRVHQIVAYAFLGPCPTGYEINHKDGDKLNTRLSNLEYVTKSRNALHANELGLRKRGKDHVWSKLTDDQVRYIRKNPLKQTHLQLGLRFNISRRNVGDVVNKKIWKYL